MADLRQIYHEFEKSFRKTIKRAKPLNYIRKMFFSIFASKTQESSTNGSFAEIVFEENPFHTNKQLDRALSLSDPYKSKLSTKKNIEWEASFEDMEVSHKDIIFAEGKPEQIRIFISTYSGLKNIQKNNSFWENFG